MQNYVDVAYDEKEYPRTAYPEKLARYLYDRFGMQPGMKFLDNGAGRGEFLAAFGRLGLEVHGTDIVQGCEMSLIVNLNSGGVPFPDDYFDVVFSKSVIEHIENQEHYMQEMKRVLKPGGLLILMAPDWKTQRHIFYLDPTHIHPYTQESIDWLLRMMGFKDVHSETFVQLPAVWDNPLLGWVCRLLQLLGPVSRIYKNKFLRFSRELMVLGTGRKAS